MAAKPVDARGSAAQAGTGKSRKTQAVLATAKPNAADAASTKARPKSAPGAKRAPKPTTSVSTSTSGTTKTTRTRTGRGTAKAKRRVARGNAAVAEARFSVGDVVRHRLYPFRGVIFDIDPVFANTEEWWQSIPEKKRPRKNQPFYHLLAENAETEYIAYVSEQNLLPDTSGVPVRHPQVAEYFVEDEEGRYRPVFLSMLN